MVKDEIKSLTFDDNLLAKSLFGPHGENIKFIERELNIGIGVRGNLLHLKGNKQGVDRAVKVLDDMYTLLENGHPLEKNDVGYAIRMIKDDKDAGIKEVFEDHIYISFRNKVISPKSPVQKLYIDAVRKHNMVFGIGPAGTGKTYLAMAVAVEALAKKEVDRIILTRPAVEAGEKLGFLPGDILEKINPYLRPLYDALHDMMDFNKVQKLIERGTLEVAPLAFMRGRTLNDSFVILDEAQNTTTEQMKMFLTRLGFSSKAVITGDITQVDLPSDRPSGLIEAQKILKGIKGISFITFSEKDVVRHPLVQKIIKAYERADTKVVNS
ncbi:MAG: PhoH family protein [Thermodesulfobacteriota bacterium]